VPLKPVSTKATSGVGKAGRFNSDQRPVQIVDRAFKVIWLQRQKLRYACSSTERPR
jgi:hypothetical protein